MAYLHLFAVLAAVLLVLCYGKPAGDSTGPDVEEKPVNNSSQKTAGYIPVLIFGSALLVRLLCACLDKGFRTDINCFAVWVQRMQSVGPGGFYSADAFTDYPPGFLYYLYLVGGLCSKFHIAFYSQLQLLLLKLPAVACDIVCGALIYREAQRRLGRRRACMLAAAYLFQPAIILNSALWGQVDSILTLAVMVMCLMLMRGYLPAAYIAFGLGVLLKPQMLIFAPVLLAGILDQVFLKDFSWRNLAYQFFWGLGTLVGAAALCLPFGLGNVLEQYEDTLQEYPYAAVNACNFWGAFGQNWVSQEERFLLFTYRGWGGIVVAAILFFAFFISLRGRKPAGQTAADGSENAGKYPLIAAFVIVTMFVFSIRMHERYLYPALALLLLAYLYWPEEGLYFCFGGFSVLFFYNTAWVFCFYDAQNYHRESLFFVIISEGMMLCAIYLYYLIGCRIRGRKPVSAAQKIGRIFGRVRAGRGEWEDAFREQDISRITRTDILLMAAISLVYAGFALRDLGDAQAPVTVYEMEEGEQIVLKFAEAPASFSYYIAPGHKRNLRLRLRSDAGDIQMQEALLKDVFKWQTVDLEQPSVQVDIILDAERARILELCFWDALGQKVLPANAEQYAELFDEQELCPERSSFRNSMYFDEIYHGRTAYEYLHGLYSYENTHPPLGKIFIALGVAVFGMNPFGWRIAGTVFGILMVPAVYVFGKKFTGSTAAAALAGMLYAFDFMHFVQTRIATIDVYVTFFVILMYLFMYLYVLGVLRRTPQDAESWKRDFFPLGLCGVCMGLGAACKWTGVYAGLGLAAIFFMVLFRQYQRTERGIFMQRMGKTIVFCLIFFVCVPAVIYLLSYLPFVDGVHDGLVQRMLYNQRTMFRYHSRLESTHAYSSLWYQWPVMKRPIWYYSGTVDGTLREGISAFGNPLVWWAGIPALLYMLWRIARYHDGKALFLAVSYAAQYLPWMFISRLTFIYHYFPSVVFVVLMIVYGMQCAAERISGYGCFEGRLPARRLFLIACLAYMALAFGLFLLFYPVLSGMPVEPGFVKQWLRWGKGWVLVSG